MAYNDYGAFVYLDGRRQRDHEDVTLGSVLSGSYDPSTAGGIAIYADLLSRMDESDDGTLALREPDAVDELRHAVLGGPGDGVFMTVYKVGFWAARLFLVEGGNVTDEMGPEGIRHALGLPDEMEGGGDPMWEGVFDRSFEWHGCTVTCEMLDDEEAWRDGRPLSRARLAYAEGDGHAVWDAFFGPSYGAGLSDIGPGADRLFDELASDGWPRPWRGLSLSQEQSYIDDEIDDEGRWWSYGEGPEVRRIYVTSSHDDRSASDIEIREFDGFEPTGHTDKDGNEDERYYANVGIRVGGRSYDIGGDDLVDIRSACGLLNVGIALGRAGIDYVEHTGDAAFDRHTYALVKAARESGDVRAFLSKWAGFEGDDVDPSGPMC